jgi:hypothetical protein
MNIKTTLDKVKINDIDISLLLSKIKNQII